MRAVFKREKAIFTHLEKFLENFKNTMGTIKGTQAHTVIFINLNSTEKYSLNQQSKVRKKMVQYILRLIKLATSGSLSIGTRTKTNLWLILGSFDLMKTMLKCFLFFKITNFSSQFIQMGPFLSVSR